MEERNLLEDAYRKGVLCAHLREASDTLRAKCSELLRLPVCNFYSCGGCRSLSAVKGNESVLD